MLAVKPRNLLSYRIGVRWRRGLVALGLCGELALALVPAPADAGWTAAIKPDPLTRQPRCLLSGDVASTPAGHDDTTPVALIFNGGSLLAITQSELDPSFADLQLVIDKNPPIHSDKTARKTILIFDQNLPELVRQLREGRQATLYLRFWPTWPETQSFPINFSLAGFSKAYDALNQNCQPPAGSSPPSR